MQQAVSARTPLHLWIVGGLATLWNAIGAYDYLMTRMRNSEYIASMMPNVDPNVVFAWVDAMPIWAQIGWGLGVWMGLLGSVLLLLRSRWAVWSFGLSFIGIVLGIGYQIAVSPPPGGNEGINAVIPYLVIVFGAALFFYARAQAAKGLLR
jgi:hypothetical protein